MPGPAYAAHGQHLPHFQRKQGRLYKAELNQMLFLVEARLLHERLHVLRTRGLGCTSRNVLREMVLK